MRMMTRCAVLGAVAVALILGLSWSVRGASPPPSIDALHNTWWELTVSGTAYDLAGGTWKASTTITTTLTKLDQDRVGFSGLLGGMNNEARYQGGVLMQSYASAGTAPMYGTMFQAEISGTPGKMKMKGQYTTFSVDDGYDFLRVQKLSAKQIAAP